jgi:hypothetical protein
MDSYLKKKLLNHLLTFNDVSNNVNLDTLLKFDLGYREFMRITTFLNYLNHLQKDIFAIINNLDLQLFS